MPSKKIITPAVVVLSLALAFPTIAAQPNGWRSRETRDEGVATREGRSFIERVVRAVRKGIVGALDDTLTVPTP